MSKLLRVNCLSVIEPFDCVFCAHSSLTAIANQSFYGSEFKSEEKSFCLLSKNQKTTSNFWNVCFHLIQKLKKHINLWLKNVILHGHPLNICKRDEIQQCIHIYTPLNQEVSETIEKTQILSLSRTLSISTHYISGSKTHVFRLLQVICMQRRFDY